MRKVPLPGEERNWDYSKYALYTALAVLFTLFLIGGFKNISESSNE